MIKKNYYKVPFENIDFNSLPFKVTPIKFLYAYHYATKLQNEREISVCGVLDAFENFKVNAVKNNDSLFFKEVLFFTPPTRGLGKWEKVNQVVISEEDLILPKFRYSPMEDDGYDLNEYPKGKWFVLENGYYGVLDAKKSTYSKVCSLEESNIYAEDLLRVRTVVELVKRQYNVTEKDYAKYKTKFETLFQVIYNSSFTKYRVSDRETVDLAAINIIPMLATKQAD